MEAPVNYYLVLAAILFGIGVLGVLLRRNVIVILMSVELMLSRSDWPSSWRISRSGGP